MRKLSAKQKFIIVFLLVFGTFCQSMTMIRSGLVYPFGMAFWGPNGHDGVWHLALANQVLKDFPPPHPTFANERLTNYHYFFDFLLALTSRLSGISSVTLYFQIFPVIFSFLIGVLSFLAGVKFGKNFWSGFWLAFFNYFGSSFGYLVTLLKNKTFGGESLFWSMQSVSTLINPPYALSLIMILLGILTLTNLKKEEFWKIFLAILIFGFLANIKSYAGVITLAALFFYSVKKFFKDEKHYCLIFIFSLLIFISSFLLINKRSLSLFVFQPFWFVHSMIESQDRLYLPKLALLRLRFLEMKFFPGLLMIEFLGLVLFLFGNLGTRAIFLINPIWKKEKKNDFDFFLTGAALIGFLIPLFFIQKGTPWNTIQFFYYFLFFVNFYAALAMSKICTLGGFKKYFLIILIVLLTLPTNFSTLKDYFGWPPPTAISKKELEGLNFLKSQNQKTVLTFPYDEFEKRQYSQTPIPIKAYESTAYVSAFSGQQTFFEDQMNLNISGYKWETRAKEVLKFFQEDKEIFWARGFLKNNNIGYIYLTKGRFFKLKENQLGIKKIYENEEVKIFEVQ